MPTWRPLAPAIRAAAGVVVAVMAVASLCACGPDATSASESALPSTERAPGLAASDRLDAAIEQVMARTDVPGVIVGIWGPEGDYVRAFGVANKTTRAPMKIDMYTRIGSITKTFTITALLKLVDQGKLRLDDPIAKFIPGVPSGDVITIRFLSQMQSGLVTYDGVPEFEAAFLADPQRTFTPQQLLNYALDKPLQFPPGTKYDYCNTNTVLLGLVVEKLSGQRLADYVSDNILVPLKLTHTSVPSTSALPEPHPQGYTVIDGTERVTTDWNPSWAWSNGNMISTLDDMRIWARALSSGELLSEEMRNERFSSALPMSETAKYGVGAFESGGWIGHSGVTPGFETVVVGLPEEQTTLALFANTDVPHEVGTDLARAVTEIISPGHVYR
ncbi:serine hydrolase [Mycolicibacterium agri]|uniref:Serine hydrolase n=1 Tax=Mycolicibacterium agri TaxID=36811 RepID=A0A2A7MRW9_MYCAG|nr:serine hydrolase domain-containing protein [Mycolicibacterium agri]PEG34446.1 serine hydrolase [Mycolicibacterium agri]GFG51945.1 serine hydrolase [Mycolicibacterium agri]